jgi:hypothetical protein
MGVWHGESAPGVSSLDAGIDAQQQQQQQQQQGGGGGSSRNVAAVGSGADVKLYRYPSIEKRPTARSLVGHGGTVRGVRFADKGNILLSIGADQAVMVWQRRRR